MDIGRLVRELLAEPVSEPVPEVIRPIEALLPARIDLQHETVIAER